VSTDLSYEQVIADLQDMAHTRAADIAPDVDGWPAAFAQFLSDFYPRSTPHDLLYGDRDMLFAIAVDMFTAGHQRHPQDSIIRILNPRQQANGWATNHTVVQIINTDMPFLVDSITGALSTDLRYRIHMMHHPVLTERRDPTGNRVIPADEADSDSGIVESYIYVEIDAQSDADVLREITETLEKVLADVNSTVRDFKAMLAKIDETVASLTVNPPPIPEEEVQELIRFLRWLGENHFTFLGFREYGFSIDGDKIDYQLKEGTNLGILRDTSRNVLRDREGLTQMSPEIIHFLQSPEPLYITKANVRSTVHRGSHMDYVGVKIFNEKGEAIGERRFVGLFTSLSYSKFAADIPVLRRKVEAVKSRAPYVRGSYGGKTLNHIIEAFPRDELFQVSENWLYDTVMGVVQLMERPRTGAFVRPDKFERFVSALVYVPREAYHSALRIAIGRILCKAYNGEVSVYHAQLSDNVLARWHFIIRTKPGNVPVADIDDINRQIADAAQGWQDRLLVDLVALHGEEKGNKLNHYYRDCFPTSYRENFTPAQGAQDIETLEQVHGQDKLDVDFYRHAGDGENQYRLKLYHGTKPVPLSDCMPVLEDMGFRVLGEDAHRLTGARTAYIHDFLLERTSGTFYEADKLKPLVADLFLRAWYGDAEQDGFNELVLSAGLSWDQIVLVRAYAIYLRQLGLGFSPDYMADCLVKHEAITKAILELFKIQFDPDVDGTAEAREEMAKASHVALRSMLEQVPSIDEDRILRAMINSIRATKRTNFYQNGVMNNTLGEKSGKTLAFKIASRELSVAPKPRPYREIWVYSPQVEGVHLRSGPVSRGGLRWSDRREDFRTEVLGLVKAQQVKNAVIVPQGAKGGFLPKQLPAGGSRDDIFAEGVSSYKTFISSLLSLTDDLQQGKIIPPAGVVRRDDDDPYLVVAADKGTATFSDTANGISQAHGFWLDDAFASGGSNGYDHKAMGITARGAWVSVQRHMRERGINVQEEEFTVIGIGDMAGDVFGNGMLLSKTIRLQAAFNHMHIFLDPNPGDSLQNWEERKRLFHKPRSSWADYNADLISAGGGVFSRSDKSITLSPEVRTWLGISDEALAPNDLIYRILKAEADLLWFGGIGTYVREAAETNGQVGDRANDPLRVTADELRVHVVGEGGNLGMTQRARIAFAQRGGMVNTDFIDNSAGVDCSDKEVNIKILLTAAIAEGALQSAERNDLLESMTDEVADIVLSDNYLQTQAISLAIASASRQRENHMGLMRTLERDANLDRALEYLPSDEAFAEMAAEDRGLSGPEIATLMAYSKISLTEVLMRGSFIDDAVLRAELEWGFPTVLRERFAAQLSNHQLRRELVATVLANDVVNMGGMTFIFEVKEETGLAVEDIVASFVAVREIFGLPAIWQGVQALDYKVNAAVQYDMLNSIANSMKTQVLWLLRNVGQPFNVADLITRFREPVKTLFDIELGTLSAPAQEAFVSRRDMLKMAGVDDHLATFVGAFEVLSEGPDIISVAEQCARPVADVAKLHFALGDILGFDWLRARSERITVEDHWSKLAVRSTLEDLADQQRVLVRRVADQAGDTPIDEVVASFKTNSQTDIIRADRLMEELTTSGGMNVAKLSFAARHLRSILR